MGKVLNGCSLAYPYISKRHELSVVRRRSLEKVCGSDAIIHLVRLSKFVDVGVHTVYSFTHVAAQAVEIINSLAIKITMVS